MSKVIIDEYDIKNKCILNNQRIAFISDIHSDAERLSQIIEILKKLEIKTLLIGGDLIDAPNDYFNDNGIKEKLKELSKTMKIYIGIGNHEVICYDDRKEKYRTFDKVSVQKYWDDLNLTDNIYVSILPIGKATITKWSLDSNIDIISLNMPIEFYNNRESYEEFKSLLTVLDSITIDTNKYNILLYHSPNNIVENGILCKKLEKLKKFNLILSGHMHAGMVPKILRKKTYGKGLVGPYSSLFPKYTYGLVENEDISLLTSGGVKKISDSAPMGPFTHNRVLKRGINSFYLPEIEILNLGYGETNCIKKLKIKKL